MKKNQLISKAFIIAIAVLTLNYGCKKDANPVAETRDVSLIIKDPHKYGFEEVKMMLTNLQSTQAQSPFTSFYNITTNESLVVNNALPTEGTGSIYEFDSGDSIQAGVMWPVQEPIIIDDYTFEEGAICLDECFWILGYGVNTYLEQYHGVVKTFKSASHGTFKTPSSNDHMLSMAMDQDPVNWVRKRP